MKIKLKISINEVSIIHVKKSGKKEKKKKTTTNQAKNLESTVQIFV